MYLYPDGQTDRGKLISPPPPPPLLAGAKNTFGHLLCSAIMCLLRFEFHVVMSVTISPIKNDVQFVFASSCL
jgi:hypothetical protein